MHRAAHVTNHRTSTIARACSGERNAKGSRDHIDAFSKQAFPTLMLARSFVPASMVSNFGLTTEYVLLFHYQLHMEQDARPLREQPLQDQ